MKILMVSPGFSFNNIGGLSIRLFNYLKILSEISSANIDVVYVMREKQHELLNLTHLFNKMIIIKSPGKIPQMLPGLYNQVTKIVDDLLSKSSYDIVYANYVFLGHSILNVIQKRKLMKIIDMIDAVSLHYKEARLGGGISPARWFVFKTTIPLIKHMEKHILDVYDKILITSYYEKQYLLETFGKHYDEKIIVSGNGVDEKLLNYKQAQRNLKHVIGFLGSLNYYPNVQAATRLLKKIFPVLKKNIPKLKCFIIGKSPSQRLKKLTSKIKGAELIGFVPNIEEFITENIDIMVLPMKLASGIQNKLLTSLALGIPTIISKRARFSSHLIDGVNVLFAESDKEYIEKILKIYKQRNYFLKISKNAKTFAIKYLSWNNIKNIMKEKVLSEFTWGV